MLQTLGSFTQQYPDINLSMNYTTSKAYPALCAARNAASMDCDVIQISYEQFCCKDPAKSFYSLSSIKDYLNLHLQSEESLSWGTSGDTLYALSNSIDLPAFYYNEELLHLDVSIPSTWEDLSALADACSREMKKRAAADSSPLYPLAMTRTDLFEFLNAWIQQRSGCTMFDEDGMLQYTETQLAELLTFYQTLIRDRLVLLVDEPAFAVSSGQAAGCFSHASDASSLLLACDGAGFTLCSGSLLTADPQTEHSWLVFFSPVSFTQSASCASQPREAAKLLRYLVSSETIIKNQGLNEADILPPRVRTKNFTQKTVCGLTLTACMPLLEDRDAFSVLPARLASGAVRDHFLSAASEMMERSGDPAEYATRLHAALLLS